MTMRPNVLRPRSGQLSRYGAAIAASALLSAALLSPAFGQQPLPPFGEAPGAKPAKPAAKPAPVPKSKTDGAAAPTSGSDAGLRQRIEGLEEQLVDLNVVIGTLETLAKSGGAASSSPAYRASGEASTGVDAGRIAGLEAQVRSLTQQVQQLSEQVRALGGQPSPSRRDGALTPGTQTTTVATAPPTATPPGWTASPQPPQRTDGGFMSGPGDVSGGPLPPIAAAAPAGDPASARQAYESAYQFLLQQDYGAAETAFDDFLKRYPGDQLAGNAQFWLGESHFVRGQFKAAAGAFLKGYQSYGRSAKAPDSLLKLAMSLGRLGQKDSACTALAELGAKYPSATSDVKARAAAEKQRTGCP